MISQVVLRTLTPAMMAILASMVAPASLGMAFAVPVPEAIAVNQDAYIMGPGDAIEVSFQDPGLKDLNGTYEILNDGNVSLALLGPVVLDGLTLKQAIRMLRGRYLPYLINPDLNLRIVKPRPLQVSVTGEVERPGLYSLTLNEVSQTEGSRATQISGLPTVVTAIQKAGGLTLNADLSSIQLQRRLPGNASMLRETRLNLLALLREGDKTQNPFLFDGDTLVVGKATTFERDAMELATMNLSPKSIRVNVVGEVASPGRIELQANTPVLQAILAAGGPLNWRGNRSDVELVRINRNGTATRELFAVDYSQGVSGKRNPPLRDGDTIIVNRSSYAKVSDAIGAIANPISGLINIGAIYQLIRGIR